MLDLGLGWTRGAFAEGDRLVFALALLHTWVPHVVFVWGASKIPMVWLFPSSLVVGGAGLLSAATVEVTCARWRTGRQRWATRWAMTAQVFISCAFIGDALLWMYPPLGMTVYMGASLILLAVILALAAMLSAERILPAPLYAFLSYMLGD